jgi:hypothetical protein
VSESKSDSGFCSAGRNGAWSAWPVLAQSGGDPAIASARSKNASMAVARQIARMPEARVASFGRKDS